MRFKRRVNLDAGLKQIDIAPLIDCVFLLLIFFLLTSNFIVIPGINVKLPKAVTSEVIDAQSLTFVISSEDIIYLDGKPKTLEEIEDLFVKGSNNSIFIKSDRDASLGVVIKLLDICKQFNIEQVGIATIYED
ncbi:MAG: biopolymer transporter ExbD [Candidatus Omnitrophica bacterium]|nr:biopolymer transporter ExbD [Candidatus Omnitrophota bacterium]